MSDRTSATVWLERLLWATGLVLLAWVGFVWADGQTYQARAEAKLERAIAEARAAEDAFETEAGDGRLAPLPATLPGEDDGAADSGEGETRPAAVKASRSPQPRIGDADVVGKLEVPRLGLSVMVSEGTTARVLRRGAGHLKGTPRPGSAGNAAIAGHRDRHFRPLRDILPGDELVFTGVDGTYRYEVQWTSIVKPDHVEVLKPTDEPALTLVTCYPFSYVGNAPERFIVRARQIDRGPSKTVDAG